MFLLHDNGQEVEDRIIAYTTTQNLEQLNTATTWLCDSTFATCPIIFKQLWVLHEQFNDQVMPFVFFLLPDAKTEVYTRAFKIVRDALSSLPTNQLPPLTHATRAKPSSAEKDESTLAAEQLAHARLLGPKVIIMDFEQEQFRAFEVTFNGEVWGCFFHFRQALIKNLKSKKELFNKYLNDDKGKCHFAITQFAALAFMRPEHTGLGFEALLGDTYVKKHSIIFKGYLEYFEKQWVGKKVTSQRGKSGATAPWNCQGACLKGEMKTISSLEVWQKHLNTKFGSNPKYNKFFAKLQEEQARNVSKFCNLTTQVAPKKKKSKEQEYQEAV
ncbi:hypothetical protein DSO57_1039614 [Entomophthora muscae]|uniref:Uncharacterized protein n=1 Tax=Entomophthora muscae TaxID=34485 RepID=A0ACC2U6J2_9FUNG|nr:hypothetical protein DSO57_1039614 [Entomophthora muscae]